MDKGVVPPSIQKSLVDGRPRLDTISRDNSQRRESTLDKPVSFSEKKRLASIAPEDKRGKVNLLMPEQERTSLVPENRRRFSALGEDKDKPKTEVSTKTIAQFEGHIEEVVVNPYASRYRAYPNLLEIYVPETRSSMASMMLGEEGKEFGRKNNKTFQDAKGKIITIGGGSPADAIQLKPPPGQKTIIKPLSDNNAKNSRTKTPTPFSLAKLPNFVPFLLDLEQANCTTI
jgi:hypothetical protein